jgi:GH25 family lysozyme M1 (1,4-beta-N-acetylmuramidase)
MSYFVRNQEFAFGIDLSRYNASTDLRQTPDFDQIAAHNPAVNFIAIRAGVSWGYRDPMFKLFSQQALAIGACGMPYHVLYPGEPALKQVNGFLKILEGINLDEVRLVLDVELEHGQTRSVITNTLLTSLEFLEQETGRLPIVYSRAMWWMPTCAWRTCQSWTGGWRSITTGAPSRSNTEYPAHRACPRC